MSEVITFKHWLLGLYDQTDVDYVNGLGCQYKVEDTAKTIELMGPNGDRYQIRDNITYYGLHFFTENEKQESMVMLKYSGSMLTLMRVWYSTRMEML